MIIRPRTVLDTNILISRVLTPNSAIAQFTRKIIDHCDIIASQETVDELVSVMQRLCHKGVLQEDDMEHFISMYKEIIEWVPVIERIQACRDLKDDKFLELAVNGNAEYIVTGDKDLLVLHPFRDILIVTPADYVSTLLS